MTDLRSTVTQHEARITNLQQELEVAQQLTKEMASTTEIEAQIERLEGDLAREVAQKQFLVNRAGTVVQRYKEDDLVRSFYVIVRSDPLIFDFTVAS